MDPSLLPNISMKPSLIDSAKSPMNEVLYLISDLSQIFLLIDKKA